MYNTHFYARYVKPKNVNNTHVIDDRIKEYYFMAAVKKSFACLVYEKLIFGLFRKKLYSIETSVQSHLTVKLLLEIKIR